MLGVCREWIADRTRVISPVQTTSLAAGGVGLLVTGLLWRRHRRLKQKDEKIKRKQEQCQAAFKYLMARLDTTGPTDVGITQYSLEDLISKLQSGEIQPQDVIAAYQKKALEVNEITNCIQQPIKEAASWAEYLQKGSSKGPLNGVPVSIKDHVPVQGYDTTMGGCTETFDQPFPKDSVIVKVLKKQGAVPFVFTNAPQGLLSGFTTNPVFGTTVNPLDVTKGVGGSSGGEGALIAGGGSVLGLGTDIGGSIRIPQAFCGGCGLKPTVGRLSTKGFPHWYGGQTAIVGTVGPMARDVESLAIAMRALLVPYMWELDSTTFPLPFRDQVYEDSRPLKIGYYKYDGIYPCIPAVQRGVDVAVNALRKQGHTVVAWEIPEVETARELMFSVFFADEGRSFLELVGDDELIAGNGMLVTVLRLPKFIRRLLANVLKRLLSEQDLKVADPRGFVAIDSVHDWWQAMMKIQGYRHRVIDSWKDQGLDAVICPVTPCVALPHGVPEKAGRFVNYTMFYNTVNFPAGVVPVTKVTPEDEQKMKDYPAQGFSVKALKKGQESGTVGLPVAVQCASLPYQEEVVLRVMREIQNSV